MRTAETDPEEVLGAGAPHLIPCSGWRTHRGSDSNTMLRIVFIRSGFAMSSCILAITSGVLVGHPPMDAITSVSLSLCVSLIYALWKFIKIYS